MKNIINNLSPRSKYFVLFFLLIILTTIIFGIYIVTSPKPVQERPKAAEAPPGTPILSFDIEPKDKQDFTLKILANPNGATFNAFMFSFSYPKNVIVNPEVKNPFYTKYTIKPPVVANNNIKVPYGFQEINDFTGTNNIVILEIDMRRTDDKEIIFTWDQQPSVTQLTYVGGIYFDTGRGNLKLINGQFPALTTEEPIITPTPISTWPPPPPPPDIPGVTVTVPPPPPPGVTIIYIPVTPLPPPKGNVSFNLSLAFHGILKKPSGKNNNTTMPVRVTLISPNYSSDKSVIFTATDKVTADVSRMVVWDGQQVTFNDVPQGNDYAILIKGPKHLQKRICVEKPTETQPGRYSCSLGQISLKPNDVKTLDYSTVIEWSGDLPNQDGMIDAYDIVVIRNYIDITITNNPNITTSDEALNKADINLDDAVNTIDFDLLIQALQNRADEQ